MSVRKPSKKCVIAYTLLVVLLFAGFGLFLFHRSLTARLSELCRFRCSEIVNRIITQCAEGLTDGKRFYTLNTDSSGRAVSVSADTEALNRLQNELRSRLNQSLSEEHYESLSLTVGDLTDSPFLSGRGFEINVRFQQTGVADTRIESSFISAGINQTRMTVMLTVSVEFKALLPSKSESITVTEQIIVADELIVGDVPDFYSERADNACKS